MIKIVQTDLYSVKEQSDYPSASRNSRKAVPDMQLFPLKDIGMEHKQSMIM